MRGGGREPSRPAPHLAHLLPEGQGGTVGSGGCTSSISSARRHSTRLSTSRAMGPAAVVTAHRGRREADTPHPFCSGDPHCLASEGGDQDHDQGKRKRPWGQPGSGVEDGWSRQTG